ncbi:hypothetical protein QBC45DRAFT_125856 [Copromyces sp. CBS 386.78]|nr:hypothetical protein QBC45DRAFT_125856 [Copromyces sp. CBS 386.78]
MFAVGITNAIRQNVIHFISLFSSPILVAFHIDKTCGGWISKEGSMATARCSRCHEDASSVAVDKLTQREPATSCLPLLRDLPTIIFQMSSFDQSNFTCFSEPELLDELSTSHHSRDTPRSLAVDYLIRGDKTLEKNSHSLRFPGTHVSACSSTAVNTDDPSQVMEHVSRNSPYDRDKGSLMDHRSKGLRIKEENTALSPFISFSRVPTCNPVLMNQVPLRPLFVSTHGDPRVCLLSPS